MVWNTGEHASLHRNISKYPTSELASRKSPSPEEIATNLSVKQKAKQRGDRRVGHPSTTAKCIRHLWVIAKPRDVLEARVNAAVARRRNDGPD